MTTIDNDALAAVSGGIRGQSPEQIEERRQNICHSPNDLEARLHYDTMVDKMAEGGVWPRTVKAIGELCGWPVPEGARNAKPIGPT